MRLIEVAQIIGGIQNRLALFQQHCRLTRAFNLLDHLLRDTRCSLKAILQGARRKVGCFALYSCRDNRIMRQNLLFKQTIDEHIRIVKSRYFPFGTQ